jgi:hypothetical protein
VAANDREESADREIATEATSVLRSLNGTIKVTPRASLGEIHLELHWTLAAGQGAKLLRVLPQSSNSKPCRESQRQRFSATSFPASLVIR